MSSASEVGERDLLIGRSAELAFINSALVDGHGVFVSGSPGVGKTHLIAATATQAEEASEVIAISGAQSASAVPLAPLLRIADLDSDRDLASSVIAELARLSRSEDVLLVVDDCHLLDQASAALIHQAASSGLVAVLLAGRSTEPNPTAIESLWKDGLVSRLDLEPMDRTTSDQLAKALLGEVAPQALDWLWTTGRGHPLFIRELTRALAHSGVDYSSSTGVETPRYPDVPERLSELISTQLAQLEDNELRGLAAVELSQPVPQHIFEHVCSSSIRKSLLWRGLIREQQSGFVVGHPLYGEVATQFLNPSALDELRRELAEELDRHGADSIQLAELLLDAGEVPGVESLSSATKEALSLRQPELAKKLATALVELDDQPSHVIQLAMAHAMNGDWDAADPLFERSVSEVKVDGAGPLWIAWLSASFNYGSDLGHALMIASKSMDVLIGADHQVAKALWLRCRMFTEPIALVFDELSAMRDDPDLHPRALAYVGVDLPTISWHVCRPHVGLAAVEPLELPERGAVDTVRLLQANTVLTMWGHGRRAAEVALQRLKDKAQSSADPFAVVLLETATLLVAARCGKAQEAVSQWEQLRRIAHTTPDIRWIPIAGAETALAMSALRGREDECQALIAEIEAMDSSVIYATLPHLALAKAKLALRSGDLQTAFDQIAEAVEHARQRNAHAYEILCLRERTYLGKPDVNDIERASEIASHAGPGLATLIAQEMRAVLEAHPESLASISRTAGEFGATSHAWESVARAQALHLEEGELASALVCELAVEDLGRQLPNQFSLTVESMKPVLTPGQRPVADLSATGATNAEIAEQLFLSRHTVKRHLEDIYRRLEISGRQELRELYERGSA